MGVFSENAIIGASGVVSGYNIDNSMYMPDAPNSSPKLSRTMTAAGSTDMKWTFATWYKKGRPTTSSKALYWVDVESNNDASTIWFGFQNDSDAGLRWNGWNGSVSEWDWDTDSGAGGAGGWLGFRDYASWYHIMHVLDYNTSPYVWLYVNGVLQDPSSIYGIKSGNGYASNFGIVSGDLFRVGSSDGNDPANGYMADTYFIEGQALTPASFTETDGDTGQLKAIEYTGTYSGNSFFLEYKDSADFGTDSSGLGNDFTAASIPARHQMIDTPQNNKGSNFAVLNPLCYSPNSDFSEGNLKQTGNSAGNSGNTISSIVPPATGKWYWETLTTNIPNTQWPFVGTVDATVFEKVGTWSDNNGRPGESESNGGWKIGCDGEYETDGGGTSAGGQATVVDDVVQFALDHDNGALYFGVNNTWYTPTVSGGDPTSGGSKTGAVMTWTAGARSFIPAFQNYNASTSVLNFGQDSSFTGRKTAQGNTDANANGDFYYTPPAGYLALCTDNLPDPAIPLPEENFNAVLYTGDGNASNAISGVGFQPDWLWLKSRSATTGNIAQDVVRGATNRLETNSTGMEVTDATYVASFGSDGFTVGSNVDTNASGGNFVAWNWKAGGTHVTNTEGSMDSLVSANPTAGFSVVGMSTTGTGGTITLGHGLSQAPQILIGKPYVGGADNWRVGSDWHNDGSTPWAYVLLLNTTSAEYSHPNCFNSTAPTASVFTAGSDGLNNGSYQSIIYCFHSVEGYSKMGVYTGNGNADGSFIYTGFRPAYFFIKNMQDVEGWNVWDNSRDEVNKMPKKLSPNTTDAEYVANATTYFIDFVSNGVKLRTSYSAVNDTNDRHLFMAFAEYPFKYTRAK